MRDQLLKLCAFRRKLSDKLPRYTPRCRNLAVQDIQELDAEIIALCAALEISESEAWQEFHRMKGK